MKKPKEKEEDQLQSEFNMSVADMVRMDELLKDINKFIMASARFRFAKYLGEIYSGLRIIYETMRPVANQSKKERYDALFRDIHDNLYKFGKFDQDTYLDLLNVYREIMVLRQRLGFGVRVSSDADWTDEIAVDK